MIDRRGSLGTATLGGAALASLAVVQAHAQTASQGAPPAGTAMSERLNEAGPEAHFLATRVGTWDVTETIWPAPHAVPITSTGLVAERVMIGTLLQEFIRPPTDTARLAVKRTSLLCYNRLDGRWDYVSFDARDPVGLMPAWSQDRGDVNRIMLSFAPLAVVGGTVATGQFLRMRQEMTTEGPDHDRNDQYFTMADGTATEWLNHRYDYVRAPDRQL